ncbi:hypothetical protein P4S91_13645 [Aneurinibacillus aneurinilyticus]|uniref:YkoP-like domain-containing protein n=1 Tax=Aneurinibacillus aneurinilyticus ATCC 12856 TaxID=649747 RepID=U1WKJ3_ANEAE|nr:hypothetical protein [Aneurinibacillus aneurinilyticus]ERI09119.1 hypothetical protein HMPREF0083_02804 [Aneurinibacillus aneurinilyticus ATCC 12856]MED0723955.1 hypothetical protein [Aneurinibacillus aneurinilyticus]MED0735064.1 hypothetical protein [Aneurinibacillus aneurinilyticus]
MCTSRSDDRGLNKLTSIQVNKRKRWLISIWMKWEGLFRTFFHLESLDENNHFLCVRVRTYRGKTLRLADGQEIRKGDQIAELHVNNALLFKMRTGTSSSMQLAIQMIRATEQILPKIPGFLLSHPNYRNVTGIYGVSFLYRGAEQFGFTVIDLPKGMFCFLTKIYLRTLFFVIHPQGKQRLQTKTHLLIPKIITMSTKELMRRYHVSND